MKKLKTEFNKHGARYVLKKRTDRVAMYYVYGSQSSPDYVTHIEVFIIRTVDDQYGFREIIPSDSRFGTTSPAKAFCGKFKYQQAEPFYELLSEHWNDENLGMLIGEYEKEYLGIGAPGLGNPLLKEIANTTKI